MTGRGGATGRLQPRRARRGGGAHLANNLSRPGAVIYLTPSYIFIRFAAAESALSIRLTAFAALERPARRGGGGGGQSNRRSARRRRAYFTEARPANHRALIPLAEEF